MGEIIPFEKPAPRARSERRRPCSCPDCRRCPLCAELIEVLGVKQDNHCSFGEACCMGVVKTLDQVLTEFSEVVMTIPAPTPKKKT